MKHYQILVKGVCSNALKLIETSDYIKFKKLLATYNESQLTIVITTNIYMGDAEPCLIF